MSKEGAIRIIPAEEGRFIVLFPYTAERVARIRTIRGRRWHYPEKYWTVPGEAGMLERLAALFPEDHLEAAPSRGGPPPAPAPSHDSLLKRVHEAVVARHLSPRTEQA